MRIILFLGLIGSFKLFAHGSNIPPGYWSCTYVGRQWDVTIGPDGSNQYEIRTHFYSGKWMANKDAAKADALDYCQQYSVSSCQFSDCDQHSR